MIDRHELSSIFQKGLDALEISEAEKARAMIVFAAEIENSLRRSLKNLSAIGFAAMSIRELKEKARGAGISRYSFMSKADLVAALISKS
jgi:predicted ribosome-associated RNA-binding protein Tma20